MISLITLGKPTDETPKSLIIQSINTNASNADTNTNLTFEQFCHSNRARILRWKTVFFAVRYQNLVIWNHGAGRVRHIRDHSTVFVCITTEEEKEACVSARNFTLKK